MWHWFNHQDWVLYNKQCHYSLVHVDSSVMEISESDQQNKTKMMPTNTELLSQSKIIWKSGWKVKNGTICNYRFNWWSEETDTGK